MRYLLDTNVCVMYLNGRSATVRDQRLSVPIDDFGKKNCATLADARTQIEADNLHITTISLTYNLILTTHNTRGFRWLSTLQIKDRGALV
jgi:tRNA(fMet)-specific endonuclease VapC